MTPLSEMVRALIENNAQHLEVEAALSARLRGLERENRRLRRRLSALWRRTKRLRPAA